jgi:hypothetical protein
MDRILRQYEVLADRSLIDDYDSVRRGWLASARNMRRFPCWRAYRIRSHRFWTWRRRHINPFATAR